MATIVINSPGENKELVIRKNQVIKIVGTAYESKDLQFYEKPAGELHSKETLVTINNIKVKFGNVGNQVDVPSGSSPTNWSGTGVGETATRQYSWSVDVSTPDSGYVIIYVEWTQHTQVEIDGVIKEERSAPASKEHPVTVTIDVPPDVYGKTYKQDGITPTDSFECQAPGESIPVLIKGTAKDDYEVTGVNVGLDPNPPLAQKQAEKWAEWNATVQIDSNLGTKTIRVKATDNGGNDSNNDITVKVVDTTPPDVTLIVPSENLIMDDQPVSCPVRGTAIDKASGVKKIELTMSRVGDDTIVATATADPSSNARNQLANWNTTLTIPQAGTYNVKVIAEDNQGNRSDVAANRGIVTVQKMPIPVVKITSHSDGVVSGTHRGADITIRGIASAELSTIKDVRVTLDNGDFNDDASIAIPDVADWSLWSRQIHIPPQGEHTVAVRCTNIAKNPELRFGYDSVRLRVGVEFKPLDRDNLSLLAYFKDLLDFALDRISIKIDNNGTTAVRNATVNDLVQAFFQPFDRLRVDEEVLQIRICIEVLRQYLAIMNKAVDAGAEERYRQTAYESLLIQFGTSYEELRSAHRLRINDEEDREILEELAARLGIEPDVTKLGQLFLHDKEISEANLERLFGLVDTDPTRRPPLTASNQPPLLFLWQSEQLIALWKKQDHPLFPVSATTPPIVEPDLLFEDDFLMKAGDAYDLWTQRSKWIRDQLVLLEEKDNRPEGESDHDRLVRLIDQSLGQGTVDVLLALDRKLKAGQEIAAELMAKHFLRLPAFDFLIRMYTLPSDKGLLVSEWSAVYSILVHAMKEREYDAWRTKEEQLTLGPDHFKLADQEPELPEWRATSEARRNWQETLRGRIDQRESLRSSFLSAVSSTEAVCLPIVRDALVTAFGQVRTIDVPNWLTQRLMIDVKGSSVEKTTRITQAIETLQSILSALRTDRFMEMDNTAGWQIPPGEWERKLADAPANQIGRWFDEEWIWMNTHASWKAAMRIFLYPENLLLPSLREYSDTAGAMSQEFHDMLDALQLGQRLTADVARKLADKYRDTVIARQNVKDGLDGLDPEWKKKTFVLDDTMEEADLLARAAAIQDLITRNKGTEPLQRYMAELFYHVPMQLAIELHQGGQYSAALDWFRTVYGYNLPIGQRKIWFGLAQEEAIKSDYNRPDQWLRITLDPYVIAKSRAIALTRATIISITRCFLDYADVEFSAESGEAIARARTLYLSALDLLDSADTRLANGLEPAVAANFNPNPEPQALRMQAEVSLSKLRSGRNIAGMQRQITTYSSRNKDMSDEAYGGSSLQPTPYRYSTLIERAKQLVTLAQQMEERYLSALEKKDAETYNLIKARHDLNLTQVTVQLQNLRVIEAGTGITLATLQKSRTKTQKDTYKRWIDAGKIQAERDLLDNYRQANEARNWAAGLDAAITAGQALNSAASGGLFGSGLSGGLPIAIGVGLLAIQRGNAQVTANNAEASAQANSFNASYERRKQEWQLQNSLAEKDVAIANQQIGQAQFHRQIVSQEREIAQMQANHAQATVDFLANKFTNAELYHWMSGVLGRVYNYFLQQATAVARLAENQLAFERQEKPFSLIRTDYWQAASETGTPQNTTDGKRDRRGLTGSARLLQDVYQLDQYAFETNKRKLQLNKTISLAQVAPFEFQYFRQTGGLPFATPMAVFDQDFPGHYLRLIRRVRTSVVALIPPNQGIRATLATTGLSRVTIADGGFRNVQVRRDPELVALTSPLNSTGVFELDVQSELLLPFEGIGVDTSWMFEMPKAANPFDYRTIADVLITIEYTSLHSFDYRQQVIQRLDRVVSADRSFSLRDHFPDQWYELNNSDQSDTPLSISFKIAREDYPPNIEELQVQNLILYFIGKNGSSFKAPVTNLQLSYLDTRGNKATVGGDATPIDGIISTRRGNAANWKLIISKPPHGDWNLTLPNTEQMKKQFKDREIDDIFFVITYSGQRPAWPT